MTKAEQFLHDREQREQKERQRTRDHEIAQQRSAMDRERVAKQPPPPDPFEIRNVDSLTLINEFWGEHPDPALLMAFHGQPPAPPECRAAADGLLKGAKMNAATERRKAILELLSERFLENCRQYPQRATTKAY